MFAPAYFYTRISKAAPLIIPRPSIFSPSSAVWLAVSMLLACLLFPVAQARAALESFVGELPELHTDGDTLSMTLRLSVDDEDALRVLLRDGATIELGIKVRVERKRTIWANEKISEQEFSSLLKYDSLVRLYRLTEPSGERVLQDGNLRSLLAKSWKDMRIPLVKTEVFEEDEEYLVIVDLVLQHAELPPWLDKTLVFWSREVVAPETFKLDYRPEHAAISR